MSNDRATIKVSRDTFEYHNRQRIETGLTWDQYLNQELNNKETIRKAVREEVRAALQDLGHQL
jgi:hypothetical protein